MSTGNYQHVNMVKGELSKQLQDLKVHYLNERFMADTIAQLKKDLNNSGLDLQEESEDADTIRSALEDLVEQLLEHGTERLFALLYRIDIPENEIATYLAPDHSGRPSEMIAQAILDRELKKVVIRDYLATRSE